MTFGHQGARKYRIDVISTVEELLVTTEAGCYIFFANVILPSPPSHRSICCQCSRDKCSNRNLNESNGSWQELIKMSHLSWQKRFMARHLSTFLLALPFSLNARCTADPRWGLKKQNAILSSFITAIYRTNDGFR